MRCSLVVILLVCTLAPVLHAGQPGTITVFGQASTMISPDRSVWRLTASAREQRLDVATAAVKAVVEQALVIGQEHGLSPEQMRIGHLSVATRYEMKDGWPTRKLSHYEATQRLTFIATDLERYDDLRTALTALSGLGLEQQFQAAGVDSVRDQILLEALRAAKRKAEALAAVVGLKVGATISISEFKPEATQREVNTVVNVNEIAYQRGVIVDIGRPEGTEIKATIYATFALE